MAHAILSASASSRWLRCTPSARLERKFPDASSPYALEGSRAHERAEYFLNRFLKTGDSNVLIREDVEMNDAVQIYVNICVEKINEARTASPDAQIKVEQRLDFSRWVPEGFGTGDMVMVSDKYFEIVDLKYGKGVPVSAINNSQMRLYALGMYEAFGYLYGADEVRMTIVQPRLDSVSTETISVDDLLTWGEEVKKKAKIAFAGKGEFCAGNHCRFCKARNTCRAHAEYELKNVKEDLQTAELEDFEISDILLRAKNIKTWLDGLESYALGKALDGYDWPGMKLVEGRSNRKITDDTIAANNLMNAGFGADEIYKPRALRSITDLEKLCGKKMFSELMSGVIEKPPGKPTLVSADDKRQAIELRNVKNDFDESLL
ncbi:MAG: DUF2800 domain-containing protein [Dialister sp.]|jgi:hypothetical protein|uniref:DUF2800 domain-containing protein n=1 Tax=Dialister sp. TaxID=1955814 RepID=UPI001D377EF8|nr:DUF2800 domain-containing protein [Dialister sp.]MBS6714284.1 DUF2800 domain-containing protein [Dialister sp.]